MPRSTILVDFALALPLALALSALIAWVLRRIFGRRLSLPFSIMTIVSLLGLSTGLFIAGWFFFGLRLWMPTTLLLAVGCSLGLSLLVAGVAAIVQRDAGLDIPALLAGGETESVEFKETARWNVREDKKDARMEAVVAKTVAAFCNSRGGTLVIGVDDQGHPVGLDRDLATLRTPDAVPRFSARCSGGRAPQRRRRRRRMSCRTSTSTGRCRVLRASRRSGSAGAADRRPEPAGRRRRRWPVWAG